MQSPLVSVITPAYNCEKFIKETVMSVLGQWYSEVDYTVIDDCSKDDTWIRLLEYTKNIPGGVGFARIRHSENRGEQATVNEGLKLVKGKYFMIVNADDPLLPGAIPTLVDFMEAHPDVLCGYPDWDCIDEEGKLKFHVQSREYDFAWMVAHHTWIPSVGSIFRSEVVKLIGYRDESFRWLGDGDYWLRVGLAGKMARVPSTLATWRYHNGQASGQKSDERAREHIRVMQKFYDIDVPTDEKLKAQAICWSYLVAAVVAKSPSLKASCVANAVKTYPQLLVSPDFYSKLAGRAKSYLRRRA